jgi:hypothetical protein
MPKTKISEYSATANSNTDVGGINIDEGCAPSGINDAIRTMMAQLKNFQTGSASDALTVGGALTTSSTVTHNGGTANGVGYLNGSKVLTTGSALTFDGTQFGVGAAGIGGYGKLQVRNGFAYVNEDGSDTYQLYLRSGFGGALPAIQAIGGAGLGFVLGSSEQMRLTSTGLGIGTSSPAVKLALKDTSPQIDFITAAASDTSASIQGSVDTGTGGKLVFITKRNGNTAIEQMRLDSSGNLGLGVTPSAWSASFKAIQVGSTGVLYGISNFTGVGNNFFNDGAAKYQTTNAASFYAQGSGAHAWHTAPSGTAGNAITFTQAMTLHASGGLSLGSTSDPGASTIYSNGLQVNKANLSVLISGAETDDPNISFSRYSSATGDNRGAKIQYVFTGVSAQESGGLAFYTNPSTSGSGGLTERARIDSSGNLLVGATSSITPYALIQVRGDNKGISIQDSTDNSYRAIYNQSGSLYFFNGSNEGYLSTAGSWINASDARLKTNVREIEYGLSTVLSTQPRHYERVDIDGTYIGFVAQELQAIIPEVVSGNPEKQLGVDYGSLVAVAFKAIQEQQAMIASQSELITSLTARLDAANL